MVTKLWAPFRRHALAASIGLALTAGISLPAQAGIGDALDGVFDGMSATQPGGAWESQRRGFISGGGIRVRQPIVQESLVNIQMPSYNGGCGGIDMFAGSMNFIKADQIVELFRNIASNAKAYAFHIALSTVFHEASQKMQDFQKVIQRLNAMSLNSCEAAQGLMEPMVSAVDNQLDTKLRGVNAEAGVTDAFPDGIFNIDGETPSETAKDGGTETSEAYEGEVGNIVWKAMEKADVESWSWIGGSGDHSFKETIMSLSGTLLVDPEASPDTGRENEAKSKILSLKDFVHGAVDEDGNAVSDVRMYSCSGSDCASVTETTNNSLEGLAVKIVKRLNGTSSSNGLIYYYNQGHAPTHAFSTDETNFITSLPYGAGGMIRNLAVLDPAAANSFVANNAELLARESAYALASDMIKAALQSLESSSAVYVSEARDVILESRQELRQEYQALQDGKSLQNMVNHYEAYIENLRRQRYKTTGFMPSGESAN